MNIVPPSFAASAQSGNPASVARPQVDQAEEAGSANRPNRRDKNTEVIPQNAQSEQGFSPEELKQLTELKARDLGLKVLNPAPGNRQPARTRACQR